MSLAGLELDDLLLVDAALPGFERSHWLKLFFPEELIILGWFCLLMLLRFGETGADLGVLSQSGAGMVTDLTLKASDFVEVKTTDVAFFESSILLGDARFLLEISMVGRIKSGLEVGRGEFEFIRSNLGRPKISPSWFVLLITLLGLHPAGPLEGVLFHVSFLTTSVGSSWLGSCGTWNLEDWVSEERGIPAAGPL